tara:strand:+ start:405 stop:827 length:423 start_codon:yes stop_codon:yes gene_type:complete
VRAVIKNIITEEDVICLPQDCSIRLSTVLDNPIIDKILKEIEKVFPFEIHNESFCRIEKREEGHVWHQDTGSFNHMSWCKLGGSILLTTDFSGGDLKYRKNNEVESIGDRSRFDLYIHTSDEEHMVEPSIGNRKVFLIFI